MEQSMYTWQILDWKATEGDTDVWNFHKDCGNTRVSSTRETLGRTYHNCCWCLRNGWILLELFSGSSLYENMDGHTIMFQVAVKNIYPDVTKLAPPVQKIVFPTSELAARYIGWPTLWYPWDRRLLLNISPERLQRVLYAHCIIHIKHTHLCHKELLTEDLAWPP